MKKIAVTSIGLGLILAGATGVNASALETSSVKSLNQFVEERVADSKDVFSVEKITDILKIKPTRIEGNDSNHTSHKHNGLRTEKLEPTNANGKYTLANGNIKISVGKDNKDITIEVLDESINIEYVHMKGGNAFNCYDYKGDLLNGSGKDSGLYCPVNKGGNIPEISHITIFWSEEDKEDSIPITPIEPSEPIKPIEPPTEGGGEGDKEDSIPMTPIEPSEPVKPIEPSDSAQDNQNNLDFLNGDNSFNNSKNEDDIISNNQELVSGNEEKNMSADSANNPKTGDAGIMPSIIGIVGSAIGLVINRKKN